MKIYCYFLCLYLMIDNTSMAATRIGIIGGGIGGTSCAYFLRQLLGKDAQIDIYEAGSVGGRLATTKIKNKEYEAGGAVVHPRNEYMNNFRKLLELPELDGNFGLFSLYNGKEVIFSESSWESVTYARLFWRYGSGPYYLDKYIENMLNYFSRIYQLQENGFTYNNVTALLSAMDPTFVNSMHVSVKQGFTDEGFNELMIDELIQATLTVNYGQDSSVHKFVGSVSVAGASGGLWAVHGGNKKVPEGLLKLSQANLKSLLVTKINKLETGKIQVITKERSDIPIEDNNNSYDAVILASPQTDDMKYKIQLTGFTQPIHFDGNYHRTVCTILQGNINNRYFNAERGKSIEDILSTTPTLLFNSISNIKPVDSTSGSGDVWKIFSQVPLTTQQLDLLFSDVKNVVVKDWLAYPHYTTQQRLDNFVLDDNLFYINAIEWAASAMEMSVIGAKNVALLTYKYLNNFDSDSVFKEALVKDEL